MYLIGGGINRPKKVAPAAQTKPKKVPSMLLLNGLARKRNRFGIFTIVKKPAQNPAIAQASSAVIKRSLRNARNVVMLD